MDHSNKSNKQTSQLNLSCDTLESSSTLSSTPSPTHTTYDPNYALGCLYQSRGDIIKAGECFVKCIESNLFPKKFTAHFQLASIYLQLGKMEAALALYNRIIERNRELASSGIRLDDLYDKVASTLQKMNRYQEAETYYRKALSTMRKSYLKPTNKQKLQMADTLINLSYLPNMIKLTKQLTNEPSPKSPKVLKAETKLRKEALALIKSVYPVSKYPHGHPTLANAQSLLAETLTFAGKRNQARVLYDKSLEVFRTSNVLENSKQNADVLHRCGYFLAHCTNEFDLAEKYYMMAFNIYKTNFDYTSIQGKTFPQELSQILSAIVDFHYSQKRFKKTEPFVRYRLEILNFTNSSGYPVDDLKLKNLHILGTCLEKQKRYAEAEETFRELLPLVRKHYPKSQFPKGNVPITRALGTLAKILSLQDKNKEVIPLLKEKLEMERQLYPKTANIDIAITIKDLALIFNKLGDLESAYQHFKEAITIFKQLSTSQPKNATIAAHYHQTLLHFQAYNL